MSVPACHYLKIKKMEINSITVITVLVLAFFCVLPIIIVNRKRKSKAKETLLTLQNLAGQNQGKITEYEILNDIVMGIDTDAHLLFFIRTTAGNSFQQTIDLKEFKKCRSAETGHTVETVHVIEKLELVFSPAASNQKEMSLCIYDADLDNLTLSGELQFAEKWVNLINHHLSGINRKR